ncbi:aspartate kinase [Halobacillus karajensis]|uniref:Aspartokinase n=1 Tax=Halobacillus karajensis TaxID=195088 RepID=A0A024P7P0_9BACI|nr:aspartate kinase [Halobacillus karajensis]CDQ20198.1 Aspartokinase [Halobacillus karajensis]CDQ25139.1 Aspartokinase [Halobacillus karajensis]CDQ28500.1 Aspartokinase [Halobacillus karajensis]
MAVIVQKFGGTSLQTTDRINRIADRIIREQEKGTQLVIVVSAMGDATNRLVQLSGEVSSCTNGREMDLLLSTGEQMSSALMALALKEKGAEAIAMTGAQCGIETEYVYGNAKITAIHTERIQQQLDAGKIVVVAGFQGCAGNQEICTLGRGGSDTTAAALAAELKAERCDIFTDVDGVYSADPRYITGTKKHTAIDYDNLLTMAEMGAAVVHPRAVAHAKEHQVPLVVRSSFSDLEGTLVDPSRGSSTSSLVGLTIQKELSYLYLTGKMVKGHLFSEMTDSMGLWRRMIRSGNGEPGLMIKDKDLDQTLTWLNKNKERFGIHTIQHTSGGAAVHMVFRNPEEKRRQGSLMEDSLYWGEAVAIDGYPSVWSVSVSEDQVVDAAQSMYDAFFGHDVQQPNELQEAYGV